jgi:hypothetical protein
VASRLYPPAFVDKALELASAIGMRSAARALEMPYSTLERWTKHEDYAARWSELRRDHAPRWRARAAATMEELVDEYAQLEAKTLVEASGAVDKLDRRDVGNFLRSIAVAKGVTADHVSKLRGQPNVIVERRYDAAALEQAMQQLLDSAEELPELPSAVAPNQHHEKDTAA